VVLADGTWLSPSSVEKAEGVTQADGGGWALYFERSSDGGRTWTATPPVASPLKIDAIQPSILFHPRGVLEAVARTRQGALAQTWSRDGGKTWSPLSTIDLPNPNSGTDAVTLKDGRQLIVYNHAGQRPDTPGKGPRWPLNVAISDDGASWREVLTLEREPRPDGYAYPAVIQTRDGLVHVTYTVNRRAIRHVVVDPGRLSAAHALAPYGPPSPVPPPVGEAIAQRSVGGVLGSKIRMWPIADHSPLRRPAGDTSPTGGGTWRAWLRGLTRKSAELNGKGAKRPGLARNSFVVSTVSTKTGASRGAVIRKPSDRGFLTRSDGGPRRAGHWHVPDRRGDFSPCLSRPPIPSPPRLRLPKSTCPGPTRRRHSRPPASASRSSTPESRLVAGRRPSRAFRCKHYAAGLEGDG
jgi:hypothetical protein